MNFTNDELNLMCIYDTGTRTGLMDALATMKEQLEPDETELRSMTDSALKKLEERYGVELPICEAIYRVLYENADFHIEMDALFHRSLKNEF